MNTILDTADEDSFLVVARYVGDLQNEGEERTALAETTGSRFVSECAALIAQQDYAGLFDRLSGHFDVVFAKGSEKDVESSFIIISHIVPRLPEARSAPARSKLLAALTARTDSHQEARLQVLVELYNLLQDSRSQYTTLLKILSYAKSAGLADQIAPILKSSLDDWIEEWDLTAAEKRELFLACAEVFRACKKKKLNVKDAFATMMRCFDTLEGASTQDFAHLKTAAYNTVVDFIKHPDLLQFDLWDSPPVQQLAKDKQTADVYKLLTILLTGDVQDFDSFASSHGHVFEELGASLQDVRAKVRLLTLVSLANDALEVAFTDIQAALKLEEDEVEVWVVRAIGKKLIEGKIDQLRGLVSIHSCPPRVFSSSQWRELREKLAQWRENLEGVQDFVATQKTMYPKGLMPVIKA